PPPAGRCPVRAHPEPRRHECLLLHVLDQWLLGSVARPASEWFPVLRCHSDDTGVNRDDPNRQPIGPAYGTYPGLLDHVVQQSFGVGGDCHRTGAAGLAPLRTCVPASLWHGALVPAELGVSLCLDTHLASSRRGPQDPRPSQSPWDVAPQCEGQRLSTPTSGRLNTDVRWRMKSIIVGCGRVGAGLAQSLWQRGQVVIVVDHETTAFERLGTGFKGQTLLRGGLDREVLLQAGIERADGLAAITGSDDTNVVLARLARHFFRVPRVVARLHDPRHAEVYQPLAIQAITPLTSPIP